MISFTEGDLFASGIPALAHGVNCRGAMAAGIAFQFRQRWPEMAEAYRSQCSKGMLQPGDVMPWQDGDGVVIFNLATQDLPGPNAREWMIAAAVGRMIRLAHHTGITRIGLPRIGCGIGGLTQADLLRCLRPYRNAPADLVVVTLPGAPA